MKKLIALLLCCLLLTACGQTAAPTDPTDPTDPPIIETDPPTEPTPTETQTPTYPVMLKFMVYHPNENADGFEITEIVTASLDADTVMSALIWIGVLPEGTKVNSLSSEGMQLNIDFNETFRDHLLTMGTAGERLLIGSVVNTFLNAYQAESVLFTVNGEVVESGHVAYDFPIEFME